MLKAVYRVEDNHHSFSQIGSDPREGQACSGIRVVWSAYPFAVDSTLYILNATFYISVLGCNWAAWKDGWNFWYKNLAIWWLEFAIFATDSWVITITKLRQCRECSDVFAAEANLPCPQCFGGTHYSRSSTFYSRWIWRSKQVCFILESQCGS
jgi:hypothetical protein